jgi:hypothetical protein
MKSYILYPLAGAVFLLGLLFLSLYIGLPAQAQEATPVNESGQNSPQCRLTLLPEAQSKTGLPGESITFYLVLHNYNPYSDSFLLQVFAAGWKTSPAIEKVGPVPPMGVVPVTYTVQIPQNAPPFSQDTALVYARSVVHDSRVSNIAQLTTLVKNALQLTIEPLTLESVQAPGQLVTQTVTIYNGYNFTITYRLSLPNQLPREQWLSIPIASGALPSQQSVSLPVVFSAALKKSGVYTQEITLESNAPDHGRIAIPVRMEVVEPPYHFYMPLVNH